MKRMERKKEKKQREIIFGMRLISVDWDNMAVVDVYFFVC